ncbi:hypothetical protein, partial [Acinetobacter baumannii]|uniref:hypothetical protein n=1 Tax=Acinetobacter baumannii TaxID=470 RepID=UPI000C18CFE6
TTSDLNNINEKLKKLDDSIKDLLESTYDLFHDDQYYSIESAFLLDHALNIKMHFYKSYPELAPDHLKNIEYDRIVHIETTQVVHARKKKPEDSMNQNQPNYLQNKR